MHDAQRVQVPDGETNFRNVKLGQLIPERPLLIQLKKQVPAVNKF